MSFKGQCSNCGWTTKRTLKNMSRPCPKCGGNVYVHEEDRGPAITQAVVTAAAIIALAVLLVAMGVAEW